MIETWSLLFILAEEPKNKVFLIQDDPQGEVTDVIELHPAVIATKPASGPRIT